MKANDWAIARGLKKWFGNLFMHRFFSIFRHKYGINISLNLPDQVSGFFPFWALDS